MILYNCTVLYVFCISRFNVVSLLQWFNRLHTGRTLTVRDLLSWVAFVNMATESLGPAYAILHGAFLVLLDGLSLGMFFRNSNLSV